MPRIQLMVEHFLVRELGSLRMEVEAYPDEASLWSMPSGTPNSGGTLVLHLTGNLQHYIGAVLGGTGYVRNRKAEFSTHGLSRSELLREIAAAELAIRSTLPAVADERMSERYPEAVGDHQVETGEFLLHLAMHLAYHLGQLSYHRRLVTGDSRGVGALAPANLSSARPL